MLDYLSNLISSQIIRRRHCYYRREDIKVIETQDLLRRAVLDFIKNKPEQSQKMLECIWEDYIESGLLQNLVLGDESIEFVRNQIVNEFCIHVIADMMK